ncbi:MAG TPA: bifunctional orotidine-5'-phosphate decarboxylase/orotate phosphoribosyltransferase [Oscillatoriales cyanobacterium M59_W2019_021]|nr:MAG: bifunctional orotidine-5'-phosphate decarboxylase/orotate phosphoribosyltransferase [Cyanobacteria bacterium J055]HIK31581.1 bifunctional orotidine-5'-phosphate decarboxylase/orotate phosphoribosyltransferase [Oscillatoriales cyanobacterium M4454_W2019_049]HIK50988.1 bifunctional orotidine-5'-phosphate decarboxylase/orotate phosphoribosyltransferase [Oscillatoriales cyanobacterium M59_W2019_021]
MSFIDKLTTTIARNQSLLFVGLDPNPEMLPSGYRDRGLVRGLGNWLEWAISETSDRVCAYKPTLGFYLALGKAGLELLDRILAAIPAEVPVILDAKHGDLNTASAFAQMVFEDWNVDAITLNPYAGQDEVAPFLIHPDKAVFVLCRTSNPAEALQEYPNPKSPFYLQVVKEAKMWGIPEQLGLEVGSTSVDVWRQIRAIAPERWLLARSIWGEGCDFEAICTAGLNGNGDGLLIPVSQDLLGCENLGVEVKNLNDRVDLLRHQVSQDNAKCDLWMPDVCFLEEHPHQEIILQLFDIGCILFGEFVQASGEIFPYYIDLRKIISNPQLFHQVLNAYAEILETLTFDRIAGIPYGSLPTATGLSLRLHHPMIFPRKEVKAHGTRRLVEGNFQPGETVAVVDDILISGKSVMEGAEKLKSVGLVVEDIVVFIDHERGVKDRLKANGYRAHSVLTLSEITEILGRSGRISSQEVTAFSRYE